MGKSYLFFCNNTKLLDKMQILSFKNNTSNEGETKK